MTITFGIDARAAAEEPAGRGRVVRELLLALADLPEAADDTFLLYGRERWGELGDRFQWSLAALPDPFWHLAAARRASRSCDVFFSTNSYLTAWFTRVPTAVLVHDMIAFEPGARAQARAARIERATIRPALRRAESLVCTTEATAHDITKRFPRATSKTSVVPLAADRRFAAARAGDVPARFGLDSPYVLAVGTLEPRKNLERLIDAWLMLPEAIRASHLLALAGPGGWEHEPILQAAVGAGARVLGRVSDEELAALYAGCSCFAYPSLYEGFGLPVLEAMLAGAPVVTSNVSSLPEVAGRAALLADPRNPASIADALGRILSDPGLATELRERGRAHAAGFSWTRTARELHQVLTSIARR